MASGKGKFETVIQVVRVYCETMEALSFIEAIVHEILFGVDSHSMQALVVVQHIDLRKVDTNIGNPESRHAQK